MHNSGDIYSSHLNTSNIVPTGYRVLVAIPEKEEKTRGGIYLPQDTKKQEEIASLCGRVLQLGPLAYQDADKFGRDVPVTHENGYSFDEVVSEPWCKPGDYVLMAAYSGVRFKVPGEAVEYRLINDDNVLAVVPSPDHVERA